MKNEKEEPAEKSPSADQILEEHSKLAEVGYDREFFETIYGAPGEFPAMEY